MMINHIMCTSKILTDLCCLQCFSSESVLIKHKENYLSINSKQSVKLEKGITKFEFYFKQIPVPFKIYADLSVISELLKAMKFLRQKYIKITFLAVLLIKLVVLMIDLPSQLLFIEVKMQLMNLLKQFLRSINIAKK